MKKITTILGLLFLSMTILNSCGDKDKDDKKSKKDREISVKNLDKDIDNEEDAVEAMITITKAQIELVEKAIGPPLLMMDDEDLEDRAEDIDKAEEDVWDKIIDEEWDEDDLEDADNWDEYEDLKDELEDLGDEYYDLLEEAEYDDREESYDYTEETGEAEAEGSNFSYKELQFMEEFMEECTSDNYYAMYDYCECALEELMYEYTIDQMEYLEDTEAVEFIVENTDCLELIDYDEEYE